MAGGKIKSLKISVYYVNVSLYRIISEFDYFNFVPTAPRFFLPDLRGKDGSRQKLREAKIWIRI